MNPRAPSPGAEWPAAAGGRPVTCVAGHSQSHGNTWLRVGTWRVDVVGDVVCLLLWCLHVDGQPLQPEQPCLLVHITFFLKSRGLKAHVILVFFLTPMTCAQRHPSSFVPTHSLSGSLLHPSSPNLTTHAQTPTSTSCRFPSTFPILERPTSPSFPPNPTAPLHFHPNKVPDRVFLFSRPR
jgi:hypothetical protein